MSGDSIRYIPDHQAYQYPYSYYIIFTDGILFILPQRSPFLALKYCLLKNINLARFLRLDTVGIRVAILFLVERYQILLLSDKAALILDWYFAIVYIWLSRLWLADLRPLPQSSLIGYSTDWGKSINICWQFVDGRHISRTPTQIIQQIFIFWVSESSKIKRKPLKRIPIRIVMCLAGSMNFTNNTWRTCKKMLLNIEADESSGHCGNRLMLKGIIDKTNKRRVSWIDSVFYLLILLWAIIYILCFYVSSNFCSCTVYVNVLIFFV